MKHTGRFQIHGNQSVLLDSESWIEDEPFPALKAHHQLSGLEYRTRQSHKKECDVLHQENAFSKTHRFIDGVAKGGGHGPYKFTWPKPSRKDQRRVDTEIINGLAFV